MSLIKRVIMLKHVYIPPSPSKGKKHGKKNLITNTKLFPSVECNMSFSPDPHIYFLEQH